MTTPSAMTSADINAAGGDTVARGDASYARGALASMFHLATADDFATTIIPDNVDTVLVGAYNAATKGISPAFWVRATKTIETPWRKKSANGKLFQLLALKGVHPFDLGAPGVAGVDSTTGMVNACLYVKESINYLLTNSPDVNAPRGGAILIGNAQYYVKQSLPICGRMSFIGLIRQKGGNTDVSFIKTDAGSLFTLSQNPSELAQNPTQGFRINSLNITGISFQGRDDLTTDFCDEITNSYTDQMYQMQVHFCTFRRMLPIPLYLVDSDWTNNTFLDMPWGNFIFGGSEARIGDNNCNGDGYTVGNVSYLPKDSTPVCVFRDFDNGRVYKNYITGKSGGQADGSIVRPMCSYWVDCSENDIEANWFDLSNSASVAMLRCSLNRFWGNRHCRVALFPPTSDLNGNVEAGRYRAAMVFSACTDMDIDDTFDGIYWKTANFTPSAGVPCDRIRFNKIQLVNHALDFTFSVTPLPTTMTLEVQSFENGKTVRQVVGDLSNSAKMTAPFVQAITLSNQSLTAAVFVQMPNAIIGRNWRIYQHVASGADTGFDLMAGDTIRGQGSATRVRITGADIGKYVELRCVIAGVWELSTNAGSLAFA